MPVMTAVLDVGTGAPAVRPSRRRLWIVLGSVLVLLAAGTITALEIAFHYAHAAPLDARGGGTTWARTDRAHARTEQVGPWSALVVRARPGHAQTFYFQVMNSSSVTQTILGLPGNGGGPVAEPEELAVALPAATARDDDGSESARRYTTRPVAIPPGGSRWLRYTIHTAAHGTWGPGRSESWDSLDVRVRVGWFTRTERLDFNDFAFVLQGT
jgi:hypothetical protein